MKVLLMALGPFNVISATLDTAKGDEDVVGKSVSIDRLTLVP